MSAARRASSAIDSIPWQKRAYERHRKRVKSATPTVDMNPPLSRPHVRRDAKRLQLQREKQAEIMKNNFILLQHLENIMLGRKKHRLDGQKSKCIRNR